VPGLAMDLFDGTTKLSSISQNSEDVRDEDVMSEQSKNADYASFRAKNESHFPIPLLKMDLAEPLQPLSKIFSHIFPVRAGGDYNRVFSPIQSILQITIPKEQKKNDYRGRSDKLKVTQLLMSFAQLLDSEYPLHTSHTRDFEDLPDIQPAVSRGDDWVETDLTDARIVDNEAKSILEGRNVLALDCEMVMSASGPELARVTFVDWDGLVILDKLVKPEAPITDYLTKYVISYYQVDMSINLL